MDIPFWTLRGTIDLANLRPEDMAAGTIASVLARIPRFNGRAGGMWNVALHSTLVEFLCSVEVKPWALLHDAHEAFIGDLTNPAVDYIASCGTGSAVRNAIANAKGRLDRQIGAAWKVPVQSLVPELRRADHIALRAEAYLLMGMEHEFTDPSDISDFHQAVEFIGLHVNGWASSMAAWLCRVEHHRKAGRLCPPEPSLTA